MFKFSSASYIYVFVTLRFKLNTPDFSVPTSTPNWLLFLKTLFLSVLLLSLQTLKVLSTLQFEAVMYLNVSGAFHKMPCFAHFFSGLIMDHIHCVLKFLEGPPIWSPSLLLVFQLICPSWHCCILYILDCSHTPNSMLFIG